MSLVTQGMGPSVSSVKYVMRAFHNVAPLGYVYWEVFDTPDTSATFAPYPLVELNDIVVIRSYVPQ
jgi:hypothetical protein